ncbi:MAG TPA: hypothetical protein V6D17_09255 [Candidatus Obscuribacterales bacterium]
MKDGQWQWKLQAVANLIEGRVVDDSERVEVCIKGTVLGFPATLEAFRSGFPFGVTYFLEVGVLEDKSAPTSDELLNLTICPRHTRGLYSFIARILLLESKGQPVNDPRVRSNFICSYNTRQEAERFVNYPGVLEKLMRLEHYSKFSELLVRAKAGLCLSQPQSFQSLNLDVCKETFKTMGEIGQVLFEAF